ncbi:MAG: DNA gyrase subunit A [Fusobacteriota bacterium]
MSEKINENITDIYIEDEMKASYLDYSMSVIVSRALPDARDGLKPVHRRILYAMNEMGMFSNKPHKKSARIVGEVLGKYHPHGDTAVYHTMVRMAQEFNYRYLLVDGHGNFGSIDGDSAAAMRYTEARMSKISKELMVDIKKDTVDFTKNFDDSLDEPAVLPAKLPHLLLNGASGIAVGMATNIPPHNLGELIDGITELIDNPDMTIDDLNEIIKAPDFPTGGIINGTKGVKSAYRTGKGKIKVRGKVKIEKMRKGKEAIIINELPYQVNKARLIKKIAKLAKDRKIKGITNLRDESDRDGIRVVIEIKRGEDHRLVLNKLYKYTSLQKTFGANVLALVNKEPKVLNLKQALQHYINHRFEVVTRRTKYKLRKAKKRAHILEGYIIALDNIDEVIKLIKASQSKEEAISNLIRDYDLSEDQAAAVLKMRLQRLTGLEKGKIEAEHAELKEKIAEYELILSEDGRVYAIIKTEIAELKEKYNDERRTEIIEEKKNIKKEDLIKDETSIVTLTNKGYIKRMKLDRYKVQNRGGKGIKAHSTQEEDFLINLHLGSNLDSLLIFTDRGKAHSLKVYEIPKASRKARGTLIGNIIKLREGEKVKNIVKIKDFNDKEEILFMTKKGKVKKCNLKSFESISRAGLIAIKLDKNDNLVHIGVTNGENEIMAATKYGKIIRFSEKEVRCMGRTAKGVKAISLKKDDEIVSGVIIKNKENTILTLTENGYGKQTKLDKYNIQSRAGQGVRNLKTSSRTGNIVSVQEVEKDDEIMLITSNGVLIRTNVESISVLGRNTQGVKIMNVDKDEKVVSVVKVREE